MKDGHNWGAGLISLLPEKDEARAHGRGEKIPVTVPHGATDVRVDDMGDGRARITLDLPWAVALLVLDELTQVAARRDH